MARHSQAVCTPETIHALIPAFVQELDRGTKPAPRTQTGTWLPSSVASSRGQQVPARVHLACLSSENAAVTMMENMSSGRSGTWESLMRPSCKGQARRLTKRKESVNSQLRSRGAAALTCGQVWPQDQGSGLIQEASWSVARDGAAGSCAPVPSSETIPRRYQFHECEALTHSRCSVGTWPPDADVCPRHPVGP